MKTANKPMKTRFSSRLSLVIRDTKCSIAYPGHPRGDLAHSVNPQDRRGFSAARIACLNPVNDIDRRHSLPFHM
jgi:hypothetical protein